MIRKFFGLIIISVGVAGVVVAYLGALAISSVFDNLGADLRSTLALTSASLDSVSDTIVVTRSTLSEVQNSLTTAQTATDNLSTTIETTRPLLEGVNQVAGADVPEGIEAIQATIPNVVTVANTIDNTLIALDSFSIDTQILGFPLQFDLGIGYDPDIPFGDSIQAMGDSLDGLPRQLRTVAGYLEETDASLVIIGENLGTMSDDLGAIKDSLRDVDPILVDYVRLVGDVNDSIRATSLSIDENIVIAKRIANIGLAWLALSQLAPVYIGFTLLANKPEQVDLRFGVADDSAETDATAAATDG